MYSPGLAPILPHLPHDLFYEHIIPDILSDHLHRVLVQDKTPDWHPFYILPLVSRDFQDTCQKLCRSIFGLLEGEGGSDILSILKYAQELWDQANLPIDRAKPVIEYSYGQLMSSRSLIQVYMCAAVAKSYLNLDVLWHLDLERRRNAGEFNDEDEDMDGDDGWPVPNPYGFLSRRFKMRDDNMHRVYLPFTCAMRLCDRIRPQRVAHVAADYLASIAPFYATAPVMLKYAQDLESYVTREHRLDLEMWINWTCQTLSLIQQAGQLVKQMQEMGTLVKSFKRGTSIPWEVINDTNILRVLDVVASADWGPYSREISHNAVIIRDGLIHHGGAIETWS